MKHFVLAITGPSGSGKSTVAEKLAKQLEKCVNIDADHIKHMIVSGFYKDESPGGWGFDQWSLVGDSIGLLAANFVEQGYDVIINGYIDPEGWANIENHTPITHKILLLPDIKTTTARDTEREEEYVMGKDAVVSHHNTFSTDKFYESFTKIESTNHTVDETIQAIKDTLGSSVIE